MLPGALVAPKKDVFIIEVHDTGPGISLEKYPSLFTPIADGDSTTEINHSKMANSGLGLYSVATEISSLGGEYGVFPRQDLVASHPDHDDSLSHDAPNQDNDPAVTGCVFWLSVPLVLPESLSPPRPVAGDKKMIESEDVKKDAEAKSSVTDDSKLMPAPVAIPVKRSLDTTDKASADICHAAKKPALSQPPMKADKDSSSAKTPSVVPMKEESLKQDKPTERAKRVLVIDDSLTIRKGLSRGFSRLGFEVDEAENGLQGFKKLKAGLYELVLLDFLMPVMDGPDVARKFRAWEQDHRPDFHQVCYSLVAFRVANACHLTADISLIIYFSLSLPTKLQYIIGISAHANGKDAELGIKAGMDRFMGKPVPLKSLKDLAQVSGE